MMRKTSVTVTPKQLERYAANMPVQHEPFDEDTREKIRSIAATFAEVKPETMGEWELGFRRDTNPDREIALWLRMREIFIQHTAGMTSPAARNEVYLILTLASAAKRAEVKRRYPDVLTHREFSDLMRSLYPNDEEQAVIYSKLVVATLLPRNPESGEEPPASPSN